MLQCLDGIWRLYKKSNLQCSFKGLATSDSPTSSVKMRSAGHYPLLAWKRPESEDFPKVWHTFKVRDIHSDKLIEYKIQDLPQDRVGDFYQHLIESFVPDEPVGQAHGYQNDPLVFEDYRRFWAPIIAQRTALVCFKAGSEEIVGGNLVYISSRGDIYPRDMRHEVSQLYSKF